MEKLILARHGEFDPDTSVLNQRGIEQANALAHALKRYVSQEIVLLSSTGPRAIETAEIIAKNLGLTTMAYEELGSTIRGQEKANYPAALEIIIKQTKPVVVVVTKGEFIKDFFDYFGREKLSIGFPEQKVEKGSALVLDYVHKRLSPLV